jgi:hypothetical protein
MESDRVLAGGTVGIGASILVNVAWGSWPGSKAFKLKALAATSPTGEPQKSPLAFIEHYHWGLASMILARYAGEYSALLDGFGIGMVASELAGDHPFGIGKSREEVTGNAILGSMLVGTLLCVLGLK